MVSGKVFLCSLERKEGFQKYYYTKVYDKWTGGIREGNQSLFSCPELPEPVFVTLLRSLEIDSQPGGPVRQPYLSYRPARLNRLAKSIPQNGFLGSINVYKYGLSYLAKNSAWAGIKLSFCRSAPCSSISQVEQTRAFLSVFLMCFSSSGQRMRRSNLTTKGIQPSAM
jgi:hypothetical protein